MGNTSRQSEMRRTDNGDMKRSFIVRLAAFRFGFLVFGETCCPCWSTRVRLFSHGMRVVAR